MKRASKFLTNFLFFPTQRKYFFSTFSPLKKQQLPIHSPFYFFLSPSRRSTLPPTPFFLPFSLYSSSENFDLNSQNQIIEENENQVEQEELPEIFPDITSITKLLKSHENISNETEQMILSYDALLKEYVQQAEEAVGEEKGEEKGEEEVEEDTIIENLVKAKRLFVQMVHRDIPLNFDIIETMFRCYCLSGDLQHAEDLLYLMISSFHLQGNQLLSLSHQLMRRYLEIEDDVEKAKELLLHLTREAQMSPETETFAIVLDGYCSRGEILLAEKFFSSISSFFGIKPKAEIYNILLDYYVANKEYERADELFALMKKSDVALETFSINIMIQRYYLDQKFDEAQELFSQMLDNNLQPDELTISIVVKSLCARGETDLAEEIFNNMAILYDVQPTKEISNILLKSYYTNGQLEKAANFVRFNDEVFASDDDEEDYEKKIERKSKDRRNQQA